MGGGGRGPEKVKPLHVRHLPFLLPLRLVLDLRSRDIAREVPKHRHQAGPRLPTRSGKWDGEVDVGWWFLIEAVPIRRASALA